ncbi:cyclic nucleotide-binding domain-containing protein [Myxosarcina sp. GI1]|uniref:cyclic nucleotide-binding domain-containing protein n=1 Tax=Myxosarcina sp. GI1 TaxID=1541065 RepID=UPI00055A994F|nr:cyclic nucleotide-binding domain-containing protein [Myxosarcina sp. GI1]
MLCTKDLLQLELFRTLPPTRLEWVCNRARRIDLAAGDFLVREGDPPQGLFVSIEGEIEVTRRPEGIDILLGHHESPSFFGEVPILAEEISHVTLRASTDCRVYEISSDDFETLLQECREFGRCIFRILTIRVS